MHTGGEKRTIVSFQECERSESKGRERGEGVGGAEISIAARLQIHGKDPHHEGYWQQLTIPVVVLIRRQREKEGEEREKGGREGGGEGEQVVQTVESYISSPRLRIRFILFCCWSFFLSEGDKLCIILRIFPQCSGPHSDLRCRPDRMRHPCSGFYNDLGNAGM